MSSEALIFPISHILKDLSHSALWTLFSSQIINLSKPSQYPKSRTVCSLVSPPLAVCHQVWPNLSVGWPPGWLRMTEQELAKVSQNRLCASLLLRVVCYQRMHRVWPHPTSELGLAVKVIECHSPSGHWASRPWKALIWLHMQLGPHCNLSRNIWAGISDIFYHTALHRRQIYRNVECY